MNLMQQYIDEQPRVLRALLDEREALTREFVSKFGGQPVSRVVLFGSGSSYHAALMAAPLIGRAIGAEVSAIVPTRFGDLAAMRADGVLYIASSQSGRSANTYALMRRLRGEGARVAAVTADGTSPIGREADVTVCLPIGEEAVGAKTKGVTATAVTLILLALALGRANSTLPDGFYETTLEDLSAMCGATTGNIERAKAWCDTAVPLLAPAGYLDVVAEGYAYGAALEGRLKLLETIYRPVVCYEFEEYLHGVQNALCEKTYLLGLVPDDAAGAERLRRLAAFASGKGAHCLLLSRGSGAQEGELSLLPGGSAAFSGFDFLPALQTLSALLSAHCGVDVTKPRFPNFYSLMKSKL